MTLAQLFFDGYQPSRSRRARTLEFVDKNLLDTWFAVKERLCHGFSINHSAPAHKILADYAAIDIAAAAQRVVVGADDYGSLVQLGIDFLDLGIPLRMPALPLWVEFPVTGLSSDGPEKAMTGGVLIERGEYDFEYFAVFCLNRLHVDAVSPEGFVFFDVRDGKMSGSVKVFSRPESDKIKQNIIDCVWTAVRVAAALNVPRVVTKTAVTWQAALNKARLKRGKHPMLSFNRVKLHLPKTHIHSGDTMRLERGAGVRFHGVLGHLRRVERPYGPDVTWVSPHFRGDPRLGVVAKERALKASR